MINKSFAKGVIKRAAEYPIEFDKYAFFGLKKKVKFTPRKHGLDEPYKTNDPIMRRVLAIADEQQGVHMHPNHSYIEDAAMDSLDSVENVMALEEEFNRAIPDAVVEKLHTPQHVVDYLRNNKPIPLKDY